MGEAKEGTMGDFPQLGSDGRVDRRVAVAVDVGPDGGIPIEVFPALRIPQPRTFAADDD